MCGIVFTLKKQTKKYRIYGEKASGTDIPRRMCKSCLSSLRENNTTHLRGMPID